MSEPMSAGEIEDVLSSIRRLVSEELRPMTRAARAVPEAKLILTPSLRVVADAPVPAKTAGEVVGRLAEGLDDAVQFEGEVGDAGPLSEAAPMAWDVTEDEGDDAPQTAKFESFVFMHKSLTENEASAAVDEGEGASQVADPVAIHGEVLDPDKPAMEQTDPWAQAGSADEELSDQVHDPDDELMDTAADAIWLDQAEAEVMAALSGQTGADDATNSAATMEDDDSEPGDLRFDESVLREIVRDLIKEELQGALGERITRNVRKLVRVEVARALSLHDFE